MLKKNGFLLTIRRNDKIRCPRRALGFTLLEILLVIVIIALLAALALPVLHRARGKSTQVKTKSLIAALEGGLTMYETDFGDYPAGAGSGSAVLVERLAGPVEEPAWKGPYLRFKQEDLDAGRNVLDAWKMPLRYVYPQTAHPTTPFTIVSAGPDRLFDTADDIGNW